MGKMIYRLARLKDWQFRLVRIERHRDRGMTLAQACAKMRISRSTYWEWCQRVKKLSAKQQEKK
jgi:predicted DNA-binding protein (UPF0251 family)